MHPDPVVTSRDCCTRFFSGFRSFHLKTIGIWEPRIDSGILRKFVGINVISVVQRRETKQARRPICNRSRFPPAKRLLL